MLITLDVFDPETGWFASEEQLTVELDSNLSCDECYRIWERRGSKLHLRPIPGAFALTLPDASVNLCYGHVQEDDRLEIISIKEGK